MPLLVLPALALLATVNSHGKPFDAELYPPELEAGLHTLLSPAELHYMFGTSDQARVDTAHYSLVLMRDTAATERARAKRSGQAAPDAAYSLDMFGTNYNLRLQKVRSMFSPLAKIKFKEDNHTYTMRLTNDTYLPVAFLEAEMEDMYEYDYEECDNCVWSECDNYLIRSTIADMDDDSDILATISDCYDYDEDIIEEDYVSPYYNGTLPHLPKKLPRRVQTFTDLTGIVFDNKNKETFEIYSVPPRIQKMIRDYQAKFDIKPPSSDHRYVIAKRATFPETGHEDSPLPRPHGLTLQRLAEKRAGGGAEATMAADTEPLWLNKRAGPSLHIETGLFMDHEAYRIYHDYFSQAGLSNPDQRIVHLVLAFMNSIQAIYNFDSLGTKVDFSIVHLEIQKTPQFNDYGGDRAPMLTSFCEYQAGLNPGGDEDPAHWDIGLLVSGVDFWADNGRGGRSYLTMGLATVTGVCTKRYGCVIGEMGVRDTSGKPYPSTGFTSVFVMAHEIGHNLGMSHDSSGNTCPSNGYIMSPSRGTKGETVWSSCSKDHMRSLDLACLRDEPAQQSGDRDHEVYGNNPGQHGDWDLKQQCQMLMMDTNAYPDHSMADMPDICYSIKCRAPGRRGYYRAGPALEGTPCGTDKICHEGACVRNTISAGVSTAAAWSDWSAASPCTSGCIVRARGHSVKRRTCVKQNPVTVDSMCPGHSTEVTLCDTASCAQSFTRQSYAEKMCREFRQKVPALKSKIKALGYQPAHLASRVDVACTVHCQLKADGGWYAPVLEVENIRDTDPYFPDGTFCHSEGGTEYFCRNHKCVSSARGARSEKVPDLNINGNASPDGDLSIPAEAEAYFTLDSNGQPQSNNFLLKNNNEVDEAAWEVKDYQEI